MTERIDLLRRFEMEVGVMMRRIRRVIGERARSVHPDLHPASYLILAFLVREGPARSSVIVDAFDLDKGAVSRHVQQLADLGLVARADDPDDRRASILTATADARRRLDTVGAERLRLLDERLHDWTEADLVTFVDTLARYNRTLGQ